MVFTPPLLPSLPIVRELSALSIMGPVPMNSENHSVTIAGFCLTSCICTRQSQKEMILQISGASFPFCSHFRISSCVSLPVCLCLPLQGASTCFVVRVSLAESRAVIGFLFLLSVIVILCYLPNV